MERKEIKRGIQKRKEKRNDIGDIFCEENGYE